MSNDEVFTPPGLVNQILDGLPQCLFSDSATTFLDPVCKSGVFLREIAKRLMGGLAQKIPDVQERANHIFTKQLYGLAITELTGLLSRRSVYGTKTANGKYSLCTEFEDEQGHIPYKKASHTWKSRRCIFCGTSESVYGREEGLEAYAYPFIHTDKPESLFKMKFDVIIGNPPYQLSDAGDSTGASPIYHLFVEQAKKLNPRFLCMIIPARWYAGGKGLDTFRGVMLNDERVSQIHDFPETAEVFGGLNIRGGVMYFLWEKDHSGDCKVVSYKGGKVLSTSERPMLEKGADIFIRYNEAISILKKVRKKKEPSFIDFVSRQKPFGLRTFVKGSAQPFPKAVKLYQNGGVGYIKVDAITQNKPWIEENKVVVPRSSPGGDYYPHQVLGRPIFSEPGSCCTETYVVLGPFASAKVCEHVMSYVRTRFFRFLVILIKNTQDVPRRVYSFVPQQDFSEPWTDEKLYKKYGITEDEVAFIETMVRGMDLKSDRA